MKKKHQTPQVSTPATTAVASILSESVAKEKQLTAAKEAFVEWLGWVESTFHADDVRLLKEQPGFAKMVKSLGL